MLSLRSEKTRKSTKTFFNCNWTTPQGVKQKELNLQSVSVNPFGSLSTSNLQPSILENQTTRQGPEITPTTTNTESFANNAQRNGTRNVTNCHGRDWIYEEITNQINGSITRHIWKIHGYSGQAYCEGISGSDVNILDIFYSLFPMRHLSKIVVMTNENLTAKNLSPTSSEELLKLFGMLVLITRFEFNDRRELWSLNGPSKYIPSPKLGTPMDRDRFEAIWRQLKVSSLQPDEDLQASDGNLWERSDGRWKVVDEFVDAFNDTRESLFTPSKMICVDESMSRWYGLGGFGWVEVGVR